MNLSASEENLVKEALHAASRSYVFWGISVGAAVVGENSATYTGCNVQSQISGLGICAERCAIDSAISDGNKKIRAVTIATRDPSVKHLSPCGACRQYIMDFAEGDVKIISAVSQNGDLKIEVHTISELLPHTFELNLSRPPPPKI